MKTQTKETQSMTTPQMALEFLRQGNQRFVNNERVNRNLLEQVNETRNGQFPFAAVLSCIDSRTSAELIFDQGLGDIFSIRLAGNAVSPEVLGSMEFACKVAGSKLLMVLGHSKCGAVNGACDNVEMGNLTALLARIEPAAASVAEKIQPRASSNELFVRELTAENVRYQMHQIREQSPLLREMIENGEVDLIGGVYEIATGEVTFFENN